MQRDNVTRARAKTVDVHRLIVKFSLYHDGANLAHVYLGAGLAFVRLTDLHHVEFQRLPDVV